MNTLNPSRAPTLDRAEREALRRELTEQASGFDDLDRCMQNGDREGAYRLAARLTTILAIIDAIGWSEHPDEPDEQPVTADLSPHAEWIERAARELVGFLEGDDPAGVVDLDSDLLAVAVLGRLADAAGIGSASTASRRNRRELDLELLAREDRMRRNMPPKPGGLV